MKADPVPAPDTHRQQVLSAPCAEISRGLGWKHTLVQLLTPRQHLSLQRAGRRHFPPHQQLSDSSPGLSACPGGLAMSVCRRASGFGQPICNEAGMVQGVREFSSKRKRQRHGLPFLGTGTLLLQKTRLKDPVGVCRTQETMSNLKKMKPSDSPHCHCRKCAPYAQGCCREGNKGTLPSCLPTQPSLCYCRVTLGNTKSTTVNPDTTQETHFIPLVKE